MQRLFPVALLAALHAGAVAAADLRVLDVDRAGATYRLQFEAVVDAPLEDTYQVLVDYERRSGLSDAVTEAVAVPLADGRSSQVRTVMESCVLFFCKRVVQVQLVEQMPGYRLTSTVVPAQSDFSDGRSEWALASEDGRTVVRYHAHKTPNFWIPPVIGTWAVERAFRSRLEETVDRLEALAQQRSG
jgi:hypothetical protein